MSENSRTQNATNHFIPSPRGMRAAFGLMLLASAACGQSTGAPAGAPAGSTPKRAPGAGATRVEVATFEGATGADQLLRPGEVVGARDARLAAPLGGFVEQVMVKSGATVKQNQVIARIDSSTHAAQLGIAKVELEDAKRELARIESMGQAIAPARLDAARTRLSRAEAQQRLASTQLDRATIRAPFAGVIVDLKLERGEVAAPGQPIGTLLQLDPIHVSVSVGGRDVGTLKVNDVAQVLSVSNAAPLEGRIVRIEPAANLQTRTFIVEVAVANKDRRLLPGMIAQVEFQRSDLQDSVLLPQDLLVTRRGGNGVFVVDAEAVARWRPVTLGKIVGDQVAIEDGISQGDRLVTVGHRSLSDGDPVIIGREGTCCRDGRIVHDQKTAEVKTTAGRTKL